MIEPIRCDVDLVKVSYTLGMSKDEWMCSNFECVVEAETGKRIHCAAREHAHWTADEQEQSDE